MAINITQQVDYLWKKIGFGLAKTDLANTKLAINESIESNLLLIGDRIWAQSELIPTVLPTSSTQIVAVYDSASAVQCTPDLTSTQYRTWLAGTSTSTVLKDWIPPEFGSTYLIKVFLADSSSTDPVNDGVQLFSQGSNDNDEWFFDYQAGVLHFIGENLPLQNFANKSIFITGGRYIGIKGLSNLVVGKFGNLQLKENTISITNLDGNLILAPNGAGVISANGAAITNVANPNDPTDAVNLQYLEARFGTLKANTIIEGNSSVVVYDNPGNVVVTIDDQVHSYYTSQGYYTQNITINGSTISTINGDLVLGSDQALANTVVTISTTTALTLPTGNTNQRPAMPAAGAIRFNNQDNAIEYYNGIEWLAIQKAISTQLIEPDGINKTYNLDYPTTADGIIVSTNGTLQQAGRAYLVNNQQITFAETPLVTDSIEVRFIATQVVVDQRYDTPTTTKNFGLTGIIDQFSSLQYRSAKYTASITDQNSNKYSIVDLNVIHDGNIAYISVSRTGSITSADLNFSAEKVSDTVIVRATSTSSSNSLYLQKTYFSL